MSRSRRTSGRRRKAGAAGAGDTPEAAGGAQQGEAQGSAPAAAGEAAATGEPGTAGGAGDTGAKAPAAKRRRGTRGGRRRRKTGDALASGTAAPAADGGAETPSESPPPTSPSAPEAPSGVSTPVDAPAAPAKAAGAKAARPRRRGGRRKAAEPNVSPEPLEEHIPAAGEPAGEAPAENAAEGAPKRRRRGSRGGRRRRKAVEAQHVEAAREAEEAAEGALPEAPGAPAWEGAPAVPLGGVPLPAPSASLARAASPDETGEAPVSASADEGTQAPGGDAEGVAAAAGEAPAAKSRRRGSRGGRRARERKVTAAEPVLQVQDEPATPDAGAAAAEDAAEEPQTTNAGAPSAAAPARPRTRERAARTRDPRRPRAIVRQDEGSGLGTAEPERDSQPRPVVVAEAAERKVILVTDDGNELRVALVEDGRLAEIYIERPDRKSYLGDIYQGKVESVMNGIDAAFVDFGLEKNGFLYVDEVTTPEGEKRARRIGDAVKKGQQLLVQVTKDPMGSKGARLTTKISLAGRYLVYVPGGSGVGVSRRLPQGERERLRDISRDLKCKNAGLIVRTIAEGHGLEDLKRDLRYLSRLWSRLKSKAQTVEAPGLVHKEVDISIEVARDLFNDTCASLIVDDVKRHKAIVAFLDKEAPELLPKVSLYDGESPLFTAHGIDEQIARALERRVALPSGGNLVIDHAEALTVIDVNTGRFTRGKGLEDTITKTNLEAAREVVRQLRLRDIGGIIIIDFIDMAHAKNREMVLATLEAELETDRTKTYVVELSPLGLVEMTRQNTTDGARGILTRTCPTCTGKARVLSAETMALEVERRVRALARKSQAKAWLVEVNGGVAERLSGPRLKQLEKQTGRRVFLEGGSDLPVEAYRVIAEGSVGHVQDQRIPVREGQEVEVELEFSLTYSPRDAVGYVDGYMVIVEGGRRFIGERRTVRVTATARTGAVATVLKEGSN